MTFDFTGNTKAGPLLHSGGGTKLLNEDYLSTVNGDSFSPHARSISEATVSESNVSRHGNENNFR